MSEPERYTVTFTPAARRRLGKLPLSAATALYEHLTGPVAANPHRLGKPLDAPRRSPTSVPPPTGPVRLCARHASNWPSAPGHPAP